MKKKGEKLKKNSNGFRVPEWEQYDDDDNDYDIAARVGRTTFVVVGRRQVFHTVTERSTVFRCFDAVHQEPKKNK